MYLLEENSKWTAFYGPHTSGHAQFKY